MCVCVKVWQIRVDVHMLNHDGNLMDAASIAAITALCHFRRPDVSIQGEDVTVVSQQKIQQVVSASPGLLGNKRLIFQTPNCTVDDTYRGCNVGT